MYFDAVLDKDYRPLFNGTPEETREWLKSAKVTDTDGAQVCIGSTMQMVSVSKYLAK